MIKLPQDFEIEQYGIRARLVCEEDAEFIVKLRTDEKRSRFLGHTDNDVSKQIDWIKEYKNRESEAIEYYLIFFKGEEPIVLSRLYNIDWVHLSYTGGSWVSAPGTDFDLVMLCVILQSEIAQGILGLLISLYEVRKGNTQVLNFHRNILRAYQYGETELDYLFISTPETRKNSRLKKLLGI